VSRSVQPIVVQLQRVREELSWSQGYLAARAGVGESTIAQLEAGRCDGNVATVAAMADAMGMELRVAAKRPRDHPDRIAERRRILNEALSGGKGRRR
jgi:transcriptional regulator with XRE-family HTH domain